MIAPGAQLRIRPQDPRLFPIVEKVEAGERISGAEGIALFESDDLLAVGAMADLVNRKLNGNRSARTECGRSPRTPTQ